MASNPLQAHHCIYHPTDLLDQGITETWYQNLSGSTSQVTNQSERVDQAPHLVVGQQGQQQGNRQRSGWC